MSTEYLMGDVGNVLEALLGTADGPRQEAEKHLRKLTVETPAEILLVLAQIGAQGVGGFQLDHRLLALILLRRLAFKPISGLFLNSTSQHATAPFDVIRETTRGRIETVLCAGLKDEMDTRMRKGLGKCAAGWVQESSARHRPLLALPPVLLELTTSPHPFHRFTPFQLLDMTPTLLVDSVSDPLPAPQLAQILLAGMNDPSVDVRVEAIKAVRSVLMEGVTGKEREEIGADLLHQAFRSLPRLPPEPLSHALVPLVDLASVHPNLYLPTLHDILPYLLSLISPPSGSTNHQFSPYPPSNLPTEQWEEIANPATEILLSLCELRPGQLGEWENGKVPRELVGLLIGRQVGSFDEDCQDWLDTTNLDEEDEDYPVFAEEALDRLANALGGTTILPALSNQVESLLTQQDWRCRYCALVAIAAVAEGCLEELQPRIRDVLRIISPTAKDPHARVRYAFLQCIGQLCSDCEGTMQKEYADDVLQVCLALLEDPVTRVRTHSAACLTNFFQDVELESFASYLDSLVRSLMTQFQAGPLFLQEQVLATMSNVALGALESFAPYYRDVMDLNVHTLATATSEAQQKLQGRAMECATLIGEDSTFASDAVKLAQLMITIQNNLQSDDKRSAYLMDAWTSLCQTLGDDFEPFLPQVIPPLLEAASYKPPKMDVLLSSFEESTPDSEDALVASNTSEMDEKVQAFENLTLYAFTMRGKFQPWLMKSMELSLEGLVDKHSEGVREAAAFLVPGLLQVAKDSRVWNDSPNNLIEVFQRVINAMTKETDPSFLALLYKSFTDSLHVISLSLPPQLSTLLLKTTEAHLRDLESRRIDRELQSEYMDEADREIYMEEQEDEDSALDQIENALFMVLQFNEDGAMEEKVEELKRLKGEVRKRGLDGGEGGEEI
uniref:TOG domain-containing protein n=1 Tax=Kwoniella bestiolae CBS 10118 TaxID=1296100 RepID=A0A1B9FXZ7_9TREE|nr:hypothetical protein I302_06618 [Kwoniella bestiolae CBS 10118]OCF23635.1 hypothetical protein I302_06618 [Kwoniella bestiolae CBS 10118]